MNSNPSNLVLSENDVQNGIFELLRYHGLSGVRINNGATYDQRAGCFRKKNKWEIWKGTPLDIFVFLPDGKDCWIEVKKDEYEEPTEGQKLWIKNVKINKGIAFVAYSNNCVTLHLKDYIK